METRFFTCCQHVQPHMHVSLMHVVLEDTCELHASIHTHTHTHTHTHVCVKMGICFIRLLYKLNVCRQSMSCPKKHMKGAHTIYMPMLS
jgi:hypothetical protein